MLSAVRNCSPSLVLPPDVARLKPEQSAGVSNSASPLRERWPANHESSYLTSQSAHSDVSIRAQVLRLLDDLRSRLGIGLLFIGHDLAVVRQLANRVAVMRQGELVEVATASDFFDSPATRLLEGVACVSPLN